MLCTSIGRVATTLPISEWDVKDSDHILGLMHNNIIAAYLFFRPSCWPSGLNLSNQIVPALVKVFFNFPHTG